MIPIQIESAWQGTADCRDCGIRAMVLFADLNESDFAHIHAPIDDLVYKTGQTLFLQGDTASHIFTIRKGLAKVARNTPDGQIRIVQVLRPGDVAGLEALFDPVYDFDVIAATSLSVCRIPISVIKTLSERSPRLHMGLMQRWHKAVKQAGDWLADLNFGSARRRVANIILKLRHEDDPSLTSLFSRRDMGAMSDLKLETVSREVSHWIKQGALIPMDRVGRLYRIADANQLQQACEH
jgi:CRP/FNR family transcriptional regulator